jgi:hypothetical protein
MIVHKTRRDMARHFIGMRRRNVGPALGQNVKNKFLRTRGVAPKRCSFSVKASDLYVQFPLSAI